MFEAQVPYRSFIYKTFLTDTKCDINPIDIMPRVPNT